MCTLIRKFLYIYDTKIKMKSDNVITRAGNHYGEEINSTFSGDIKVELQRLMMVHMEGKQWQGNTGTPAAPHVPSLGDSLR